MIQHLARLSEALATLLVPHDLRDHPEAVPLMRFGTSVEFEKVSFQHFGGRRVFADLNLRLGLALAKSGNRPKAKEHFEKVIKLAPDGPEAAQASDAIRKLQPAS